MAEGKHFDDGKLPLQLIPPSTKEGLAEILNFGLKKYGPNNWTKGMEWSKLMGSVERHWLAWTKGEDIDKESKMPHLWHLLCDVAFLVEYSSTHKELDDRPFKVKQ